MKIRIKAKVVADPCIFLNSCQGACDWCKTHSYTEACVGMLQHQVECLRKNWVAAEAAKAERYTIEEIAQKLCKFLFANNNEACWDGSCPAADYCTRGRNGMVPYLREVLKE